MTDVDIPDAGRDPCDILATLEQSLVEIDQLGLGVVAVELSLAIESLRSEISSTGEGATAATRL